MYKYYCPTCKKECTFDEVDIQEISYEGDYHEVHMECDTQVIVTLDTIKPLEG